MSDIREKTVWFGKKRGIRYEINRFKSFDPDAYKYSWTFYLWLSPDQFPESLRQEIKTETYYTAFGTPLEVCRTKIHDLNWHGGMTWSSDESRTAHPFKQFKFGCDFQHLWDMGKNYDLSDVDRACDECIESLYRWCPEIISEDKLWDDFRSKFPGAASGGPMTLSQRFLAAVESESQLYWGEKPHELQSAVAEALEALERIVAPIELTQEDREDINMMPTTEDAIALDKIDEIANAALARLGKVLEGSENV